MGNAASRGAGVGDNANPEVRVDIDDLEVKINNGGPEQRSGGDVGESLFSMLQSAAVPQGGPSAGGSGKLPSKSAIAREIYSGGTPLGVSAFQSAGLVGTEKEQVALISYFATLSEDFKKYQETICRVRNTDNDSGFATGGFVEENSATMRMREKFPGSREVYDPAENWPQFVLLSGPPGTGKTRHIQAWSRAMGLPLIMVDRKEEGWIGKLDAQIGSRDCIIFFDELDGYFDGGVHGGGGRISKAMEAVGLGSVVRTSGAAASGSASSNAGLPGRSEIDQRFPSQFRQFLDGTMQSAANQKARIIVAGTTNAIEKIPRDIVHRGELIHFQLPTSEALDGIWKNYAGHLKEEERARLVSETKAQELSARDVKVCAGYAERHMAVEFMNNRGGTGYAFGGNFQGLNPPRLELYQKCIRKRKGIFF